jgi:hypothetical protein
VLQFQYRTLFAKRTDSGCRNSLRWLLPKPTAQTIFTSQKRQQDFGEPSA